MHILHGIVYRVSSEVLEYILLLQSCVEIFIDKAHLIQNMYKYVLQADRGEATIKSLLGSAVAVGLTIH